MDLFLKHDFVRFLKFIYSNTNFPTTIEPDYKKYYCIYFPAVLFSIGISTYIYKQQIIYGGFFTLE